MKVSIVTPSFNQAKYLPRTLGSVGRQTYLDVEHIILDPGSRDDSREIILQHSKAYPSVRFVDEPDDGQVDAINKGLRLAKGEVVTWLNSDDYYVDTDVIRSVVDVFIANPTVDVVYGKGHYVDQDGKFLKAAFVTPREGEFVSSLANSIGILQPALFFRRKVFESLGGLDPTYNLSLDYEYWLRMAFAGCRFKFLDRELTAATLHADSKTVGQRGKQYAEICQLMQSYYGMVGEAWIRRFADFLLNGSDGILRTESTRSPALEAVEERLWRKYNLSPSALYSSLVNAPANSAAIFARWKKAGGLDTQCVVLTTASAEYFVQLMTLIAGIHRTSVGAVSSIVVFDLSLSDRQRQELFQLDRVIVLPYPRREKLFDGYFNPKSYVYKCLAMDEWSRLASHGDRFLWIDTGVVPLKSLAPMFALLDEEELFIVNHDDRTRKPFRNVNFTHSTALDRLKATAADALGEHMCSCLIGCRLTASSGMFFREAYLYSRDEQISNWPKHLSDEERSRINLPKKTLEIQRAQFERLSPEELMQVPLERVVAVYEYWGHRQDQSIFSILAYRYGARALSAVMYCYSSDASSYASKKNWESQGEWAGIERGAAIPEEARHAYTFHHRGTYASLAGLRRRAAGSGILGRRLPTLAHEQSALQQDILQQDTVGDHVAVEELVGPFGRRRRAHVHEAEIVATLLAKREAGSVMIDVGAHTGSALAPFVAKGWLVFAFEPDNANRLKLLERLANSSKGNQVTIDTRCVGDRSHSGLAFFTSENGGVSGLSSFDESHVQTQVVDVVSLTEFFADRDLPEVDFLKISTEGHELFVLKGFPWSRGRPEVIECSFDDQKTVPLGYNFSDVAQFLIDHGYEVFLSEWHPITPHETTSDWHCLLRYPCELSNEKAWGNLLAFRVRETAAELPAAFRKNLVLRAGQRDQRFPPKRIGSQQGFAEGTLTLGVTTFEGGGEFEAVDARTWRYQRSKENADLWLSSIKPDFDTVGCSFVGSVRLLSDCDVSVEVALGRHGSTPWEGRGRTVQLTAGREVRIKLTHHFERAHQGIRLQVRVKTPSVSACLLQLDRVAINETVESFRRRNGLSEPSFAHANRLYRAGDYMAALFTYLPLSTRDHHHHVVTDNLLLAAWKLGWPRELPTHELQYVLNL